MTTIKKVLFISLLISLTFWNSFGQTLPNTINLKGEILLNNKQKLEQGGEKVKAAFDKLILEANILLEKGPYTVTKKKYLPKGIVKNDYLSLAPYWWPDSTKKDGIPFVRRDGQIFPGVNDISDRTELNSLCDDVYLLGLAFYFSNDERYSKHAFKLIDVFFFRKKTRMNPNFKFSQIIIGNENSGGNTIGALRLTKLVDGVLLMEESIYSTNKKIKKLQTWFRSFLDWMLDSRPGKQQANAKNNIATYYTIQTVTYALFIEDFQLAEKLYKTQAYIRVNDQILKNGAMPHELDRVNPWNYVKYNLNAFYDLARLGDRFGIDLWNYRSMDSGSIQDAFNWLYPYANGDKDWRFKNQSLGPKSVQVFLERYPELLTTRMLKKVDKKVSEDNFMNFLINDY